MLLGTGGRHALPVRKPPHKWLGKRHARQVRDGGKQGMQMLLPSFGGEVSGVDRIGYAEGTHGGAGQRFEHSTATEVPAEVAGQRADVRARAAENVQFQPGQGILRPNQPGSARRASGSRGVRE